MNDPAINYIRDLTDQRFWGFLTLKYEDGKIVHVRQEQNLKPSELPGKNRGSEHERNSK
jgi:major membrane immunogen (membrane-anchored lipoprotein)